MTEHKTAKEQAREILDAADMRVLDTRRGCAVVDTESLLEGLAVALLSRAPDPVKPKTRGEEVAEKMVRIVRDNVRIGSAVDQRYIAVRDAMVDHDSQAVSHYMRMYISEAIDSERASASAAAAEAMRERCATIAEEGLLMDDGYLAPSEVVRRIRAINLDTEDSEER